MLPQQWTSPCGNKCTRKYAAFTQLPWRVFCKKGCDSEGDCWEDCLGDCNGICYKDPVIKNQQWSAYIDRSPGQDDNSIECFHACIRGCAYKFNIPLETADAILPDRPPKHPNGKTTLNIPAFTIPFTDDVTAISA